MRRKTSAASEHGAKKMEAKNLKAPVVKASAVAAEGNGLFGFLAGEFKIIGDIESPVFFVSGWKATKK